MWPSGARVFEQKEHMVCRIYHTERTVAFQDRQGHGMQGNLAQAQQQVRHLARVETTRGACSEASNDILRGNWFQSLFKNGYANAKPADDQGFLQGKDALWYEGNWLADSVVQKYLHSLFNNFFFALVVVPLQGGLALLLALLVNQKLKGRNFFRTIYFGPVVTSMVVVSIVWTFLSASLHHQSHFQRSQRLGRQMSEVKYYIGQVGDKER